MTAQRRSSLRPRKRAYAGLFVALATAASLIGLGVVAQPALAADGGLAVAVTGSPGTFNPGDEHDVTFTVTNNSPTASGPATASVALTGAAAADFTISPGTGCQSQTGASCNFDLPGQGLATGTLTFKITAKSSVDVVTGGSAAASGTISVTDNVQPTADTGSGTFSMTLNGPKPPPSSTISGTVRDSTTGQPVKGAIVNLQDSANPAHNYITHTNSKGQYSFTAGGSTPVIAGPIVVGASKDGYDDRADSPVTFTPGRNLTGLDIVMKPTPAAPPSATPSAAPSSTAASAPPSTPGDSATPGPSTGAAGPSTGTSLASNSGGLSGPFKLVLILGIILLLAGAAAAIYLFVRRKRDDSGGGAGGSPQPIGGDDGTGYANSRPYAMAEPTMAARMPSDDSPTMVHPLASTMNGPRRDVPPVDPYQQGYQGGGGYGNDTTYAAPGPGYGSSGGYGSNGGYGSSGGYGSNGSYGSSGGYGAQQPGYGAQQPGYGSSGGYGAQQPGYGAQQPGYGSSGGYGGQQPGYGAQQPGYGSSGGYGGQQPGYGSSGGYGAQQPTQGGDRAGYGQPYAAPSRGPAGYEDATQAGGYGSSGGYGAHSNGGRPAHHAYEADGYEQPEYGASYGGEPAYGTGGHENPAYDANGHADQSYPQHADSGYDQNGYDQNGYDQNGYDQNGYQQNAYDQNGYQQNGYDQNAYDQNAYDQNAYDQNAYDQNAYDQNAYEDRNAAPAHPGARPGGYRGGYVPPDQRGQVDWLDD